MISGVHPKLLVSFDKNGNLQLNPLQAELLGLVESEFHWRLIRERDGLIKQSKEVMWVEFNEEGIFKSKHGKPLLNRNLIMSPFNEFFTWQTTPITEIIEQKDNYIKFKTKNSNYELFKLENLEEQKECFTFTNIQPLEVTQNRIKSNKYE
jgi:hypothetical protein